MIRRTLLALAILGLSACGSVPLPFRPEAPDPLLDVAPIAGIYVPAVNVEQAEGLDGAALAEAVVRALHKDEVLAFTKSPATRSHRLDGIALRRDKTVALTWTLFDPDGQQVTSFVLSAAPNPNDTARSVAPKVIAALTPAAEQSASANSKRPRLSVTIAKAPGDGIKSLTAAMRQALQRQGYLLDDATPSHKLIGSVVVSPAPGGREQVDVAWRVLDAKEQELGTISQGNTIERGLLSGPWGSLARQVAEGGAEGVSELLPKSGATPSF